MAIRAFNKNRKTYSGEADTLLQAYSHLIMLHEQHRWCREKPKKPTYNYTLRKSYNFIVNINNRIFEGGMKFAT